MPQTTRILLVEDEPQVASFVKRALEEADFEVTVAPDGPTGAAYIEGFSYDLFLFDVMLPGISGLELCRRGRSLFPDKPILLLTALGSTDNVVMGLDSGADDYLTKPFQLAELLARIRSLLRRSRSVELTGDTAASRLRFSDVSLNLDEKTMERNGAVIDLTATEFRLLEYFLRNPRRVVSRMDILGSVWGYDFQMNTKVVDVYINYLRRKMERAGAPRLLHTLVGMGYILKEGADENSN